ncbi:hypothetical protein QOT96_27895 [Pseudomonas aeruginosa]
MKVSEVFTPGKFPEFTYIEDHLVKHAQMLHDSLDASMTVTLSGPSKSGKTVFIEKNIGKDRLVPVSGAGVNSPNELWGRVFAVVGTPLPAKVTETSGFQGSAGGKVASGIPGFVQAEANTSGNWNSSTATQADAAIDYLSLLIKELAGTGLVVFIDDFHYVKPEAGEEISKQIKDAAAKGGPLRSSSGPISRRRRSQGKRRSSRSSHQAGLQLLEETRAAQNRNDWIRSTKHLNAPKLH